MAIYWVSPAGNNNNAGTEAAPFKTITKAINTYTQGDEIVLKNGMYTEQISPKTKTKIRAQNRGAAQIVVPSSVSNAVVVSNKNNIEIDGLDISGANINGVDGSECYKIKIAYCNVHDCKENGISFANSEWITIEYNEVWNCAQRGAHSGISILLPKNISGDTTTGGFRNIIRFNKVHDCITTSGSHTDGNGIICDRFYPQSDDRDRNDNVPNYPFTTLVERNLCYGNGGAGIRSTWSGKITFRKNTAYNNNLDRVATTTWRAELHNMWSFDNIWEDNIGFAVFSDVLGFGNHMASKYIANPSAVGLQMRGNILFNSAQSNKAVGGTTGAPTPPTASNKVGVNPLLVNPAGGNFQTQAGSPARNAAQDGKDVGWYQSNATPVDPDVIPTAAPVIASANLTSGSPFTYTAGTYSSEVTKVAVAQVKLDGVWQSLDASVLSSLLNPTVTADTQFSVLETFSGQGVTNGENRSNILIIKPAVVVGNPDPDPTLATLAEAIAVLQATNASLLERLGRVEVLTDGVNTRAATIETSITELSSDIASNQEAIGELDTRMADAENDVSEFSNQLTSMLGAGSKFRLAPGS